MQYIFATELHDVENLLHKQKERGHYTLTCYQIQGTFYW